MKSLVFVLLILSGPFSHAGDEKCIKVRNCNYDFQCEVFHYTTDWRLIGVQVDQPAEQETAACMTETFAQAPELAQQARIPANR
jgi:hypothetical protein